MRVYHDFFLVPRSRSTFPLVDPYPDPAQWYGSDRIRIQNTDLHNYTYNVWYLDLLFETNNESFWSEFTFKLVQCAFRLHA